MTINKTVEVKITEPFTLSGLRQLVIECDKLPGDSPVTITEHKSYNNTDSEPATITVRGKAN